MSVLNFEAFLMQVGLVAEDKNSKGSNQKLYVAKVFGQIVSYWGWLVGWEAGSIGNPI